ncbi:ribosomal protein S18 acetylase RimI-like enzyme [Prosthecobacter fusiformis]|uniref:Ribosomal protein S18 acetylase RimI-like enzyme n=1 Tax=Prosthecobacter fusiformis TaxID=48464 RepID=A0A4R7SSM3_9BACT|nr:GNAT family N-acetyltransferase [Prosthecobacter fusiformis]TDU81217.1 ribosomal protein S18 acetylase RimI-like enzyme [Prosthecobacter fusiformis]
MQQPKTLPQDIQIVPYQPVHADAFRRLNEEWITAYFEVVEADRLVLHEPDKNILAIGGHILVAVQGGEVVGVCALIPHDAQTYELAKMAVSPSAQGKGVGWLLGQAAIEKTRACGMTRLFLESNTSLASAIRLYRKLGFQETLDEKPHYQRCNISMEMPVLLSAPE